MSEESSADARAGLARQFDAAINTLEAALRACPDELWRANMWYVTRSDPWIWPKADREPVRERTDESIQIYSAVANVAYHCLWFLDFYQTANPAGFEIPEYVRGGLEEMAWPEDGAAPIADWVFSKEVLLRYLKYGRRKLSDRLVALTDTELVNRCPAGHPRAGSTLLELLEINVRHVREHGDAVRDFLVRQGVEPGRTSASG